jgi:hypothetical protein
VWDPIGTTLANRLQVRQNRAARIILGYRNEHGQSEATLSELQLKTLKERRLIFRGKFMYKIAHAQAPPVLTDIFEDSSAPQHNYNLRDHDFKFYLPKPKTEYLKNSIRYRGAKLWNSLTCELRSKNSLNLFNSLISDTSLQS